MGIEREKLREQVLTDQSLSKLNFFRTAGAAGEQRQATPFAHQLPPEKVLYARCTVVALLLAMRGSTATRCRRPSESDSVHPNFMGSTYPTCRDGGPFIIQAYPVEYALLQWTKSVNEGQSITSLLDEHVSILPCW